MQNEESQKQLHHDALADGVVRNPQTQLRIIYLQINVGVYFEVHLLTLCNQNEEVFVVRDVRRAEYQRSVEEDGVNGESMT